jgi:WD40-like Beta Propeller Repeat
MRPLPPLLFVLGALVVPLACSSEDKAPALGTGDSPATAGTSSRSGGPSGDRGGEGSVGASGGQASGGAYDGPPIGEVGGEGLYVSEGGAPPNPPTACSRDAQWTMTPLEAVNTPADERLLAMTPDELTLLVTRDDELLVVDGPVETAVTLPLGYTHALGASLTPDGLSLIVVAEGGLGFAEVARASRGEAFSSAVSTARFAYLNDARVNSGDTLSSPVLSADGKTLYYTARKGSAVANVWRVRGPQLSETKLQDTATLGTQDGQAKLVVGVSADERTLFVMDEALGYVTGLWSVTPAAAFTDVESFEGFETLIPNEACDRIYGTMERDGSLEIVTGTPANR